MKGREGGGGGGDTYLISLFKNSLGIILIVTVAQMSVRFIYILCIRGHDLLYLMVVCRSHFLLSPCCDYSTNKPVECSWLEPHACGCPVQHLLFI